VLLCSIRAAWGEGEDLGRRKQWRAAAMGGEGAASQGERGVAAKIGGKGKRGGHLGCCGRKKRRLRRLLTLHPTTHNPFPHPCTEDQLLVNIFWDITVIPLGEVAIGFRCSLKVPSICILVQRDLFLICSYRIRL
jgi:hypothetical protein